jgi:hypothetical protein
MVQAGVSGTFECDYPVRAMMIPNAKHVCETAAPQGFYDLVSIA